MILYNIFLHPLRCFPGPVLFQATGLMKAGHMVSGNLQFKVKLFHDQYGPVVRIAPNELSFIEPQAWKDNYGHRTGGELPKHYSLYRLDQSAPCNIISADQEQHSILRRLLSHGFSERSMQAQMPIIGGYVDLLMQRLRGNAADGTTVVDLNSWFNWVTFDIIGNLSFGSDFKNLGGADWHPWVRMSAKHNKLSAILASLRGIGLGVLVRWFVYSGLLPTQTYLNYIEQQVRRRIDAGDQRPDFIEGLVQRKNDLSAHEIAANAEALIGAGSESTATLLSGVVFSLLTHPKCLQKVIEEVRSQFRNEQEITLTSVQRLDYMLACLNETFRYYPPVTNGMPRCTPKGGAVICGRHVPEDTVVAIWQWAICHDPGLWTDPDGFHPERFLGHPKFADDRLDALQPFSVGARNCIGRNLTYAEIRLILARLVYNFDLELCETSKDWIGVQKAYLVWDPPSLNVRLVPAVR
ncbi:P450 monooxygenase [Aspergillus sclerotioniger CBS 115572]|uniref:P450 monooxygenase n=1 Tax=Aspergillus sclerotioniger CBS 115572 TaxID=1450535 RepID=A0A317X624_9EURO|nr:P450 monooxygenase [Aspergillus sclerotioniger CBS 115572]PWY93641.1 P450 monooxygenase [Aspergillus sclerotioniger CBS 115572]